MENQNVLQPIFGSEVVITKTKQKEVAEALVKKVLDGNVSPINAYVQIKGIADALTAAIKDESLIDSVINERMKWGKETPVFHGAIVAISEGGVKYDFAVCGDSVYNDLAAQKEELDKKIKERQKFLMGLPEEGVTAADPTTGEMCDIKRPTKTSSTVVRVTFPKE